LLERAHVPQLHRPVRAAGRQRLAIGRDRDGKDLLIVPLQATEFIPGDNRLAMPPAVRYVTPAVEGLLQPGEEMTFGLVQLKLAPANAEGLVQTPELRAAPGEYSIRYTVPLGADLSPATGQLKFVVDKARGGE
jgi:hypothetical protein